MKRRVYRWLCRARGNIVEQLFDGTPLSRADRIRLYLIEIPLEAIEVWDLRHLWHPRTWRKWWRP